MRQETCAYLLYPVFRFRQVPSGISNIAPLPPPTAVTSWTGDLPDAPLRESLFPRRRGLFSKTPRMS